VRRPHIACALLFWVLPTLLHAQRPPSLDDPDIALLLTVAQRVSVMAEQCTRQHPAESDAVPAALARWNGRHARLQLDALINAVGRRRVAAMRDSLRQTGDAVLGAEPARACRAFGALVASADFDLGVRNPVALQSAKRKLGALPPVSSSSTPRSVVMDADAGQRRAPATPRTAPALSLAEVQGPAGWQREPGTDGSVMFVVARKDTGHATLLLYDDVQRGTMPLDSALKAWLVAALSNRLRIEQEFRYERVRLARTTDDRSAAYAVLTPTFLNGDKGMNVVAAAIERSPGTFMPVVMITKDDQYQYTRQREFARWFAGAALPGAGLRRWSLTGSARPGPLRGLWYAVSVDAAPNIYGGMDVLTRRHYAALYRSGVMSFRLPRGGQVDEIDVAATCSTNPRDCGTYRVDGARLIVQRLNKVGLLDTDTTTIKDPGNPRGTLTIDSRTMVALLPDASARLDGAFTSLEGSSAGPNGSLTIARTLTFHTDGRFSSSSAVGFVTTPNAAGGENSGVAGVNQSNGADGTYTIDGFRLTMRANTGAVRVATIVFFDAERPVKAVLIDDLLYMR
jgi:hypothetical protein